MDIIIKPSILDGVMKVDSKNSLYSEYFIAANAIGNLVLVKNDNETEDEKLLKKLLLSIRSGKSVIEVLSEKRFFLTLSLISAFSSGKTEFITDNKDKKVVAALLINNLGGSAEIGENLSVTGKGSLKGGEVDAKGDLDITLSVMIVAAACEGETLIKNAAENIGAFSKLYTSFGGKAEIK